MQQVETDCHDALLLGFGCFVRPLTRILCSILQSPLLDYSTLFAEDIASQFADVGQTYNSSQTISRMAAQDVQVMTLVGDWTCVFFTSMPSTFIRNSCCAPMHVYSAP